MQKIGFKQKQQGKLSPRQVQFVQLLQVPAEAMLARIQEEVEENPTLEVDQSKEDISEQKTDEHLPTEGGLQMRRRGPLSVSEEMLKSELGTLKPSLHEQLLEQLSLLSLTEKEKTIAHHLVGSLSTDGYLRTSLGVIKQNLSYLNYLEVRIEEVEDVLAKVQLLEPAGIAARDLRECLLIQLKRMPKDKSVDLAIEVLTYFFEEFSKKKYAKILLALKEPEENFKKALSLITQLSPKPVIEVQQVAPRSKNPDFIVQKGEQGTLEVSLYHNYAPTLRIRKQYRDMLKRYERKKDAKSKEVAHFVKEKIARAQWFIESIQKRRETLLRTMKAIVRLQSPFFESQDPQKLRPLFMRHIADEIGMDISTVSRVVSKKHVLTDFGTFPLKHFFSEPIATTEGKEVSSRIIKASLKEMIAKENKKKPYTDEELAAFMKTKGYLLARRTIAKYRAQLGLPVARMRKEIW